MKMVVFGGFLFVGGSIMFAASAFLESEIWLVGVIPMVLGVIIGIGGLVSREQKK